MNFRPAMLLGGAVLIAAVPVWADRIPYPGSAEESPKIEASVRLKRSSVPKMNVLVIAGFRAEPTPIAVLIDSFETSNAFALRDSKTSATLGTLFHRSSDADIRHAILIDRDSGERISSSGRVGKTWGKEGAGKRDNDTDKNKVEKGVVTAAVPEPGSLSLLLLGLAAVGFSARRRGNLRLTA